MGDFNLWLRSRLTGYVASDPAIENKLRDGHGLAGS
jgi:hypothetical protein